MSLRFLRPPFFSGLCLCDIIFLNSRLSTIFSSPRQLSRPAADKLFKLAPLQAVAFHVLPPISPLLV